MTASWDRPTTALPGDPPLTHLWDCASWDGEPTDCGDECGGQLAHLADAPTVAAALHTTFGDQCAGDDAA